MGRIIFLFVCLIIAPTITLTSTTIECQYENYDYLILGSVYRCLTVNDPYITTKSSAQSIDIIGQHQELKFSDDVTAYAAMDKTIQFFSQNLDIFYPSLKAIWIENCGLKEIHQSDLKKLSNLVNFYLPENDIEVLEEGLFNFNLKLEFVGLGKNKLIHADPKVFDNLYKLRYLWFNEMQCIDQRADNSTEQVNEISKLMNNQCVNPEVLLLNDQLDDLKIKSLKSDGFADKFTSFEKNFKGSKFSNFRPLSSKFDVLKLTGHCSDCAQLEKIIAIDSKVSDLTDELEVIKADIKSSIESLGSEQQTKLNDIENSQSKLTASLHDIELAISNVKKTQSELKKSLIKIEIAQNDMKVTVEDMSMNFELKIQGIEKRLLKGIEKLFEDKLGSLRTSDDDS